MVGSLEQKEEYWIAYILGPNPSRQFPSTNIDTKRKKWQLRFNDLDFLLWQRQQSFPILFFDGASTGNPGVIGAGGVIFESDGKNVLDYSWGLGKTTNNIAKSLQSTWDFKL
jgi:hypothetical protein